MKLYTADFPPNTRKIEYLVQVKRLDLKDIHNLEIIDMDLLKGDQKTPEFTAINPLQLLPVLVLDDGTVLNDSQAVCEYLDSHLQGNGKQVMGSDPVQRAQITAMTRNAEFHVLYNLMLAFQHGHPARAGMNPQVKGMAEDSIARVKKALPYFDDLLAKHKYLLGDRLTFADIVLYVGLDFGRVMKLNPKDAEVVGENVARFYQQMNERFSKETAKA